MNSSKHINAGFTIGIALADILEHLRGRGPEQDHGKERRQIRALTILFITFLRKDILHDPLYRDYDSINLESCAFVLGTTFAEVFQQMNGFATILCTRVQDLLSMFQQTVRRFIREKAHAKIFVRLVWSLFKILLRPMERGSLISKVIKQPTRLMTVQGALCELSGGSGPKPSLMDGMHGHCILCHSPYLEVSRASVADYSWSEWALAVRVRSSLGQAPMRCRCCHEIACSQCFFGESTTVATFDCPFCGSLLWLERTTAAKEMLSKAKALKLDVI
jgi:hypothetical protein